MFRKIFLFLMFLILSLSSVGWGKGKVYYGEAIPSNLTVVKLKDILENPKDYKDKEIILEGNFGTPCCATDFNYKEGLDLVEVYPKGFPIPNIKRGKPMRIYGIVRVVEKEQVIVYIEAIGMEVVK